MDTSGIEYLMNRQLKLLDRLAANNATQGRFITRRDMRGLRRSLRERDSLLAELAEIKTILRQETGWQTDGALARTRKIIADKQREILVSSKNLVQAAIREKNRMASELSGSRAERQVQREYINPWLAIAAGSRINEKG